MKRRNVVWYFLLLCVVVFFLLSLGCKKIENPMGPRSIDGVILPVVSYFVAHPSRINFGDSTRLSWSTENTTVVKIEPGIGEVELSGTQTIFPEIDTIFTLTAYGGQEVTTQSIEVLVFEKYNDLEIVRYEPVPGTVVNIIEITISYYVGDSQGIFEEGAGLNLFTHPNISTGGCPFEYFDRTWFEISELGGGETTLTIQYRQDGTPDQVSTDMISVGLQPNNGKRTIYDESFYAFYTWRK